MTDQQRQQRAAFFREQPFWWLFLLYASCFLGGSVANDVLQWKIGTGMSRGPVYTLTAVIAFQIWLGVRRWARQVSPPKDTPSPSATASEAGRKPVGA